MPETFGQLNVRKLADNPDGKYAVVQDEAKGVSVAIDTATGQRVQSLPLLGVVPVGDLPSTTNVPVTTIDRAVAEGWATRENERSIFRPSGPPSDPWGAQWPPHHFVQCDAVVFHFLGEDNEKYDERFTVTHQPDKYADYGQASTPDQIDEFDGDDKTAVTKEIYDAGATRVDWFYGLNREVA